MAKPIHHTIVKSAAKHGAVFVETADGGFQFKNAEGLLSLESFNSVGEAMEALKSDEVNYEAPRPAGSSAIRCGVMARVYHDRYSANPHGPGCGDTLDVEMRDAIMRVFPEEKTPRVDPDALREIGETAGLWKPEWETMNVGMRRMNLANRIRGLLRRDAQAKVTIGSKTGRFGIAARPEKVKTTKA